MTDVLEMIKEEGAIECSSCLAMLSISDLFYFHVEFVCAASLKSLPGSVSPGEGVNKSLHTAVQFVTHLLVLNRAPVQHCSLRIII